MIEVHYFASVRERLGLAREQVRPDPGLRTVADLAALLAERHGAQKGAVLREAKLLMAVNQAVARPDTGIRDGDEVAFFPPVTGG